MSFEIHVLTISSKSLLGRNNDNGSHSIKGPDLLNLHLSHIIVLAETVKPGEMGTFFIENKTDNTKIWRNLSFVFHTSI